MLLQMKTMQNAIQNGHIFQIIDTELVRRLYQIGTI